MNPKLVSILAMLTILALACATTPPEPPKTYPGVVRWQGVSKDRLFDAMVRALHFQDDYEIVPMGTAKESGLIAVRKGDDDDTVHKLIRQGNGLYSAAWAAKIRINFLIQEIDGTSSVSVRPIFKIMCHRSNLSSWWYEKCTPQDIHSKAAVHQGISNRLREDLDPIFDEVRAQLGPETSSADRIYGQKRSVAKDMGRTARPNPAGANSQDGVPTSLGSAFGLGRRRDEPPPPAAPAAASALPGLSVRRVLGFVPRTDSNGDVTGFVNAKGARPITFLCSQRCWSGTPTAHDLTSAIRSGSAIIVDEQ